MLKKKRIIYGITFVIFFLLIFFYGLDIARSNEELNLQRLQNNRSFAENIVSKNLEYQASYLLLGLESSQINNAADMQAAEQILAKSRAADQSYFLVDAQGVPQQEDAPLAGHRLEEALLAQAREKGYTVTSVLDISTGTTQMLLVVPLSTSWEGYLAKSYTVPEYVAMSTEDIGFNTLYLCLFDEWGNTIGKAGGEDSGADAKILGSVQEGAEAYSLNPSDQALQKQGGSMAYNTYFSAGAPTGWFYGTHIEQQHLRDAFLFKLPVSSLIMLCILVLILLVVVLLDIINEQETKKKLATVSHLDHLTGLVNSVGMQDAMTGFMKKQPLDGYCLVCMDIVAFSRINSMFGYSIGDMLLRVIADVIKENFVCGVRTNADCFAFLAKTEESLAPHMEELFQEAIHKRMGAEYLQMVGYKFGIYPIAGPEVQYQEIHEGALLALKDAKKNATLNGVVYDEELQHNSELKKNIEINMMHALSKEEFQVFVQPQINLEDDRCTRGETLIRWNSEFMGFLSPDQFIPIFENNGFIVETDFFMLSAAMECLAERQKRGEKMMTFAVNQSKVTISFPNYFERLKDLIAQHPEVPLEYVELEITESALEHNWSTLVPLIHSLKKLGFSVAMDDFGSGYSSLNTLRIMPIDILKIDKEFLQEAEHSERCHIIIRSVIGLAKELSIKLVCEGIETPHQVAFLKEYGCDIGQGFYYSRPLPMAEYLEKYCR